MIPLGSEEGDKEGGFVVFPNATLWKHILESPWEKKEVYGKVIQPWIKEACIFKWLGQVLNRASGDWLAVWYDMVLSDSWANTLEMES